MLSMIAINGIFVFGITQQVLLDRPFGNNPASDLELILISLLVLSVTLFVLGIRLDTRIDHEGVHVRMFPFHLSWKHFSWQELIHASVRKYKPIAEYGGWGFRFFGKKKAYSISGNMGLQLEFKSGKNLLIGTKKPDEMAAILKTVSMARKRISEMDSL